MANYNLTVNGEPRQVTDVDPDTPLLWVLRDELGLTGTKYGCGIAQCGACTVQINGAATRSCSLPVSTLGDAQVLTIEGLASAAAEADSPREPGELHPLQQAWIDHDVPQCGYCQAGQIMSAAALLDRIPEPADEDIDAAMAGNLCRCGTYQRVRLAIHDAAAKTAKRRA